MIAERQISSGLALLFLVGCQYVSGAHELEIQSKPAKGADFDCLDGAEPPKAVTGTLDYVGMVRNVSATRVIEHVKLRFCETTVDDCDDTSASMVVEVTDGKLRFTIDRSFNGYIELESEGYMPGIVELSRRLGEMRTVPEFRMVEIGTLTMFANYMNASIDPNCGHALFWAEDCAGDRAPGISVVAMSGTNDATAQYYVLDQKLPSANTNMTDASGGGGIINLSPGVLSFQAFVAGRAKPYSTFGGRIRKGQLTFMVIEPD